LGARPFDDSTRRVAASCTPSKTLRRAEAIRCDFVVLGPVAETPTHPGATHLGGQALPRCAKKPPSRSMRSAACKPTDIPEARAHGAQGIAAIRGLWNP
jgi:8-oxo-dGTP diphosphatase